MYFRMVKNPPSVFFEVMALRARLAQLDPDNTGRGSTLGRAQFADIISQLELTLCFLVEFSGSEHRKSPSRPF